MTKNFILGGRKMGYRLLWSAIQSAVVLVCLSGYAQAGLIEICKDDRPAGSLSGLSTFTIAGQTGTVAGRSARALPRFSCRMDLPRSPNSLSPAPL